MCSVPFYGALLLLYGRSLLRGEPVEALRHWACALFALAALSDALDGFIARAFEMKSQLGAYLDPFADKVLLLTSIIFMGKYHSDWWQIPLWFVGITVARDLMIICGVSILKRRLERVHFDPHWSGKMCTGLQIAVVSLYLLNWTTLGFLLTLLASFFTLWSGFIYFRLGRALLSSAPS